MVIGSGVVPRRVYSNVKPFSKTFIIITLVLNSPNELTILQNFLIVILFQLFVLFIYSIFPKQNYAKNLQVTTQAIGCSVHHQVYYTCFLLFNIMWVIFERFILECSQHSTINTHRSVFKIMCCLYRYNRNVNQLMDYGTKEVGMPTYDLIFLFKCVIQFWPMTWLLFR